MAKSNWNECARRIRAAEYEKRRFKRRQTRPKRGGVIYVQGEFSTEAEQRMREAGVTIMRREANA